MKEICHWTSDCRITLDQSGRRYSPIQKENTGESIAVRKIALVLQGTAQVGHWNCRKRHKWDTGIVLNHTQIVDALQGGVRTIVDHGKFHFSMRAVMLILVLIGFHPAAL